MVSKTEIENTVEVRPNCRLTRFLFFYLCLLYQICYDFQCDSKVEILYRVITLAYVFIVRLFQCTLPKTNELLHIFLHKTEQLSIRN